MINTIPGRVRFSVDFRHSDPAVLEQQVQALNDLVVGIAARRAVETTIERFWTSEPTPFDDVADAVLRGSISEVLAEMVMPLRESASRSLQ